MKLRALRPAAAVHGESGSGMQAFFDMGGYGAFVWPAYGLTALVLAGLAAISLRALRRSEAALDALERERGTARRARR